MRRVQRAVSGGPAITVAPRPAAGFAVLLALLLGCGGVGAPSAGSSATPGSSVSSSPPDTSPAPVVSTEAPSRGPAPTATHAPWPTAMVPPASADTSSAWLQFTQWSDEDRAGAPPSFLAVLEDGLVVALRRPADGLEWVGARRLTAAGLLSVRAQVISVGLFDRSQSRPVLNPPEGCCGAGGPGTRIRLLQGSDWIVVESLMEWPDVIAFAPSPAWDRFNALARAMSDPDGWLTTGDWADPSWRPYQPPFYCLSIGRAPQPVRVDGAGVDWSDLIPPDWVGDSTQSPGRRSSAITRDRAYRLTGSLGLAAEAAGVPFDRVSMEAGARGWAMYGVGVPGVSGSLEVDLMVVPPGSACP